MAHQARCRDVGAPEVAKGVFVMEVVWRSGVADQGRGEHRRHVVHLRNVRCDDELRLDVACTHADGTSGHFLGAFERSPRSLVKW